MRDLYIVGAGGHGREILDVVEAMNAVQPAFRFVGFLADRPADPDVLDRRDATVAGRIDDVDEDAYVVVAIGDSVTRRRLDQENVCLADSPVLIHPSAVVSPAALLGAGVLVPAGCTVDEGAVIGRHSTLNVNVRVGRECQLGPYVTVSPGVVVGERATVAEGSFLGTGAAIGAGWSVGEDALVGAGAHVGRHIAPGERVVGSQARPLGS